MSELRTSAVVDLKGNLEQRAQRYERSMRQMSRRGSRYMRGLGRAASAAGRGIDRIGNRYTALITGAGGIAAAREVVKLEQRLERLGSSADVSADKIDGLKQEVFAVAQDPQIRVSPNSLLGVVEQIVERTGDIEFARQNVRNFGRAIQATGARGQDIGGVAAEFQKMGLTDPEQVRRALEVLTVQGEKGAFTMQRLAKLGPRVFSAYTALGREGVPAVQEMGAALQVVMRGIGEPEQAATAFEALLRELSKPEILKKLQQGGIQVFDQEALEQGQEKLRPINQLMKEIVERADGKKSVINNVFSSEEATRAFNALLGTGSDQSKQLLEDLARIDGSSSRVMERSARNADTAAAAITGLRTAFQKFADDNLAEPIQDLADAVNSLDEQDWDKILKWTKRAAIAFGSLLALKKGVDAARWLRGGRGGRGGGAGGGGSLVGGSLQSPIPVYVVNKGFGSRGGGPAGGPGGGRRRSRFGRTVRSAGRWLLPLGAGYGAGTLINEYGLKGTEAGNTIGRTVAMLMSGLGSDTARDALMADAEARGRQGNETKITLGIEDDRVRLKSVAGPGPGVQQVDVEVDNGPTMPGGD